MPDSKPDMVALMEIVAKAIVDAPDEVIVEPFEENGQTVLEPEVAESDVGRIIGRQGQTINAIRSLMQAGTVRQGQRCTLEIVEDRPA